MFVGYATDHAGDCYRMWDPNTNRVHAARDVVWLKPMCFRQPQTSEHMIIEPEPNIQDGESNGDDGVQQGEDIVMKMVQERWPNT